MTWSLRLQNGDLVKGKGNSLSVIRGPEKVAQDIFAWLLEPYGTDPLNPTLGSFIEAPEGSVVFVNNQEIILPSNYRDLVISEVKRILSVYRNRQNTRLEVESSLYGGKYTLDDNELINSFSVDWEQVTDTLYIDITLEMYSGDLIDLEVPVDNRSEAF